MKRNLRKSLARLHTLLLLAVMFVVGGSAWAENWQTIYANALDTQDLYNTLYVYDKNGADFGDQGMWKFYEGQARYVYNAGLPGDDYLILPEQTLEAGKNYKISLDENAPMSSQWGDESFEIVYGSASGGDPYSSIYNKTILENAIYSNTTYKTVSKEFSVTTSGQYYIAVHCTSPINTGYLYIKNIKLEVDEDSGAGGGNQGGGAEQPENLQTSNFDFTSSSISCVRGGNTITLNSGNDTANGDKFVSDGVTMSLAGSTTGWHSSRAAGVYALYVKRGTSFTITAPEDATLYKVVINTYSGNTNNISGTGLTKNGNTFTWTGNSNSATFSSSDCYIRTIEVSYVPADLDPIDYTVHLINAPGDATITVAGAAGTYGNNAHVSIAKHLAATDITAEYDGYKTSVEINGTDINVTYTVKGAVTDDVADLKYTNGNVESAEGLFTVNSVDGYSNGLGTVFYGNNTITVTAAGKNISKIVLENGFTGTMNFSNNSFTATPNGLTSSTNGEFTWQNSGNGEVGSVTFSIPSNSTTVVSAIRVYTASLAPTDYTVTFAGETVPDGASVTIDGTQYTPSNSSFSTTKALSESSVSNVYENDDYYANVTYSEGDHTFTITYYAYTKYSVAVADGSEYSGAEAGVVVSGATYGNGTYLVGTNNIKSKGSLTQSNLAAKEVARYDGTVTLDGNTATVNYTAKVMPPYTFDGFNPVNNASVAEIAYINLQTPSSKALTVDMTGHQVDLNFHNATTSTDKTVKAKCQVLESLYGTYARLTMLNSYGNERAFDEAGVWTVTIPADILVANDGSANSEATLTYTVKGRPVMTAASPVAGTAITNSDFIGRNFTFTFNKNIRSIEPSAVSVFFPGLFATPTIYDPNQTSHAQPLSNLSGLNASISGNTITFTPTQEFWNNYAEKLRLNGTFGFEIYAEGVNDEDNLSNNAPVSVMYNYTYVVPTSEVVSSDPEVGSYSLDVREYGFSNIILTFTDNFSEDVSLQAGDDLPSGMTLTLPAGVTHGQIWANSGSKTLNIGLTGAKVAGDYRVEIAKGTFNFDNATFGQGVNAVVDKTWTLTAATKFSVNTWSDVTTESEGNEFTTDHNLKKLANFAVSAPEGKTFASVTNDPVTVTVTVGEAEPEEVSATAALVGGKAVFTFPEAYTAEGSVSVSVPAGVITTEDALTSKAFTANFTIQPYDYFNITVDPASESSHTGRLNTIVVTLPVGKTAATVGEAISLNGHSVNVTNVIDGNIVTLTLAEDFPYTTYNNYSIPAGFIIDAEGNKNNAIYPYNITVVKQMEYASATVGGETTTTNSVTVEKFSNVEIYFDEPFDGNVGSIPAGMTLNNGAENVAITGGWTQKQTWEDAYNDYKYHSFYFYFNEISAPGTYTVHIPAGVFTSAEGNTNEEVNLDIVIPEPEFFAAMTVSPATGTTMESLKTIILTAPADVTFDNVKGLQGRVTVDEDTYYPNNVEFAADKKSVTFNISEKTEDGEYTVTFPAGFVRSTDGKWSPELTATYTVNYPWFTLRSSNVTPATGEVAAINGITIAAPEGVEFATPAANVTIVVNGVDTQVGASLNADGNIVLAYNATKADRYEISIPASTFTSTTGKANKELTGLNYTIQPTLSIKDYSVDEKGRRWTTFCLSKSFTLENGYTPYILRDNGKGGTKLVELVGTPKFGDPVEAHFNTEGASDVTIVTGYQSYTFTTNDGSYSVTMAPSNCTWKAATGGHYLETGGGSCTFTITPNNSATVPAKVDLIGWDHNYTNTTSAVITEESISFTVGGSNYIGGLKIYPSTGEYNKPIVPANTGILVEGAAKNGIAYTPANGTLADVSGNLLRGCTQSATWESEDELYYKLSWTTTAHEDLGFYWDVTGGHSMRASAGKAYLVMPADNQTNSNRIMVFEESEGTVTSLESIEETVVEVPVFNLQGKRMSNPEHLPAGVYVKNGRKFIVK